MTRDGLLGVWTRGALLDSEGVRDLIPGPPLTPRFRRAVLETVCGGMTDDDWSPGLGALDPIVVELRASLALSRLIAMVEEEDVLGPVIAARIARMTIDVAAARWPRSLVRDPVWSKALQALALDLGRTSVASDETMASIDESLTEDRLSIVADSMERELEDLEASIEDAREALDVLEGIIPGKGSDSSTRALRKELFENLEEHARVISNVPELRRIAELMGRMSSDTEPSTERSPRGKDEVHSITRSSDLVRVLPSELCYLGDERLRLLFLSRFVEGRLMTYMMRGDELTEGPPVRGGPVVAMIDTSGSMAGERESLAKALLLVLARWAAIEGRPLRAVLFSTCTVTMDLSPGEGVAARFLEFLSLTFGGGTDFNAALGAGLEGLRSPEMVDGDLLFVTDGFSRLTDAHLLHEWEALKAERGARVFTVIVGEDDPGGLRALSDVVYTLGGSGFWRGRGLDDIL